MLINDNRLCYGIPGFLHILTLFSNKLSRRTKFLYFVLLRIQIILFINLKFQLGIW